MKTNSLRKASEMGREAREVVPSTDGAQVTFLSGKKREGRRLLRKATALAPRDARKETETIVWATVNPRQRAQSDGLV